MASRSTTPTADTVVVPKTWRFVSEGPWSRRRKHQAVAWQDKIVLLGGFDGEKSFDLNDVWQWKDGTWTEICSKAAWSGRDGHCAIVFDGAIFLLGGTDDPYNCKCDVWRSDDGGVNWLRICDYAPWPERWQHAACVHDGKMYVLGGWGDSYLNDVWCSSNGADWVCVCEHAPWKARMFLSAVSFNDAIYIIGGHDGRQQLRDVWASTDNGVTWVQVCQTAQWEGRQGHACVLLDGWVYIMGGCREGSDRFNDLWKSNDCAHWTQVSRASSWSPRQGHAAVVLQGSIYVLGGYDEAGYCNNMFSLAISGEAGGEDGESGAERSSLTAGSRRRPKPMVVSFLHIFERIAELRVKRNERNFLLRSIDETVKIVESSSSQPSSLDQQPSLPPQPPQGAPTAAPAELSEALFEADPRENFFRSFPTDAAPLLGDDAANASTRAIPSLELRSLAEETNKKLAQLQRQIRAAAESNDDVLLEDLILQRSALASTQHGYTLSLMEHVSAIRCAQDARQKHLQRTLLRIESYHRETAASILRSGEGGEDAEELQPEKCSECSQEDWEKLLSIRLEAVGVSSEQSDAALDEFSAALTVQAQASSKVSAWVSSATASSASSPSSPSSPESPSRDASFYEQLSNDFVDAGEALERCCLSVKTKVEGELTSLEGKEAATKALLREVLEKGYGLVKAMMTQVSMAIIEQSAEESRILRWQSIARSLMQAKELRKRCDLLVAVNGRKEDELLRLEGERIDRRSMFEKATLLQSSRRTLTRAAPTKATQSSNPDLSASLDDSMSLASASGDSGFSRGGGELDELKGLLLAAERSVKEARRSIRSWYREVRKLAIELIPELFSLIPDLQAPGSVLGDGGFAQNARVPHRLFDDYDNIVPMGAGGGDDDDANGAGGGGGESKASRHVLLKATYDGEEVVLKGFVMHDSDQRKGLERELSILGRLRSDSIICPGAIVEGSTTTSFLDNPSMQTTVFIEYPFCKGGNLSAWLKTERKPWELQGVARQLLYGLMYLHDHGVIHKDIKPSNVLMHEDGRVVLTDFELSHEVRSAGGIREGAEPSTTSRSGTRGFMSPEVEADGHALFASDMYSFGVLLFFMHFPQHTSGLVPGDPRIPANNDAELTDLIQRLLAISPSARPTAAAALTHPYFRSTFVERLVQDGEVVEQDRKLDAVRNLLYRARADNRTNLEKLSVHRDTLVDEVLTYFQEMPLERMKASLRVTFRGEPGIDEGGLLTEMFTLFFEGVLQGDKSGGLFEGAEATVPPTAPAPASTPSAFKEDALHGQGQGEEKEESTGQSSVNANYIVLPVHNASDPARVAKFRAFGRAMVKALYEGRRIGSRLCPSVFKFLTGARPNMRDLQMFDPQTARSLQWILATAGVAEFGLHFESVGAPDIGPVTDINKQTFVSRKISSILVEQREPCLLAIKAGFIEALRALSEEAAPFMSLLSHTDWRVMLCGDPAISGQQVIAAMRFSGFNKKSNVPAWIKEILLSFSEDYLRKFLVFVTGSPSLTSTSGTNKVEINVRCQSRSAALPVAHTCFFHLDVPDYKDRETLQAKLLYSITHAQGFEVV